MVVRKTIRQTYQHLAKINEHVGGCQGPGEKIKISFLGIVSRVTFLLSCRSCDRTTTFEELELRASLIGETSVPREEVSTRLPPT